MAIPRGYKNNNPGNIRLISPADKPFLGEIRPSQDSAFRQFSTMEWGYRALMKNIQALIRSGRDTTSKLMAAWAPFGDGNNNPVSYANKVYQSTRIPVDQVLNPDDDEFLINAAIAISRVENGIEPDHAQVINSYYLLESNPGTIPMYSQDIAPGAAGVPKKRKWIIPVLVGSAAIGTGIYLYNRNNRAA